jgi:hypothetical protein
MSVEVLGEREYVRGLVERVSGLSTRARAAFYWLSGTGLLLGVELPAELQRGVDEAVRRGFMYATTGETSLDDEVVWESLLGDAGRGDEGWLRVDFALTLLGRSVLPTPLPHHAAIVHYVLGPVMTSASLDLYGDIAEPGTEAEVDGVFAREAVQRVVGWVDSAVAVLGVNPEPSADLVESLMPGARVLSQLRPDV